MGERQMGRWNSKTVRIGALCLGLVLMAALIAACGGSATTTTSGAGNATTTSVGNATTTSAPADTTTSVAAAPTKMRVLISSPAMYPFYEVYVAKAQGFFSSRNLDVTISEVDGAEGTITSFASGQGDIMQGDITTLNPKTVSQIKPVMFYMFMTSIFTVAVPDGSAIQSPKDLAGKVVAVNTEQDPGMSLIKTIELKFGITIKPLIVVEAAQALAALDRGDCVAYASSLTGVARIEAAGTKMRTIIPQDMVDASGGFGYWATRDFMNAHTDAMKAFVAGLQEARAYIADDPQKLVDWANSQTPIPAAEMAFRKALSAAVISIRPKNVTPVGSITPSLWQLWWDTLVANKTIDPTVMGASTDWYTNDFFAK